jgi:hypothetical protein
MSSVETTNPPVRALASLCSLKPSSAPSSSAVITEHLFVHLREVGAECDAVRCVDFKFAPGVQADMGDSDQWPQIREKVLAADILVMASPPWPHRAAARNAPHLAHVLRDHGYPPYD